VNLSLFFFLTPISDIMLLLLQITPVYIIRPKNWGQCWEGSYEYFGGKFFCHNLSYP
jgi:hypothetical protein